LALTVTATTTTPAPAPRLFSPVIALWLIIVGVFSFSAFFVLQAYAPDLRSGNDGRAHALSRSAVGYAGLVELLKADNVPVVISRGPIRTAKASPGLLILTPDAGTDPKALAKIKFAGDALIVLPKWFVGGDPVHPGWVRRVGALPAEAVLEGLPKDLGLDQLKVMRRDGASRPVLHAEQDSGFDPNAPMAVGSTESWQTLSGDGLTPVLTDADGDMVLGMVPEAQAPDDNGDGTTPAPAPKPVKPPTGIAGDIYVLSDPDLLNTHGLKDLDTARTAVRLVQGLRGRAGPVAIDVTLHGYARGRNILKLAFEPPFLALTLCIVAAALMMGWHAYARFGPAVQQARTIAFGKAALVENSAGLIRVARREPRMGPGYVGVVRSLVARLVGAPRDVDRGELDALLDRIGRAKGAEDSITALAEDAGGLKDNAALMRLAQRLQRWRTEMTRERH
jgi:hypothetical protein